MPLDSRRVCVCVCVCPFVCVHIHILVQSLLAHVYHVDVEFGEKITTLYFLAQMFLHLRSFRPHGHCEGAATTDKGRQSRCEQINYKTEGERQRNEAFCKGIKDCRTSTVRCDECAGQQLLRPHG